MVNSLSFEGFWLAMARMQGEGTLPEWAIDHQNRSRASRERVLDAAYRLMGAEDAFTMETLASRAHLSIGALYARFPSREAVISLLGLAVMEDGYLDIDRATKDRHTASDTIRAYLSTIIALFRRHRRVIRELRRIRAISADLSLIMSQSNDRIHGLVRDRVRRLLPTDKHPSLEYALFLASAAAREGILYDALAVYDADAGDDRLEQEIHRALDAYLELDPPASRTDRPRP